MKPKPCKTQGGTFLEPKISSLDAISLRRISFLWSLILYSKRHWFLHDNLTKYLYDLAYKVFNIHYHVEFFEMNGEEV